jgi:hypothetical protein
MGSCFTSKLARELGACEVRVLYSLRHHEFAVDCEDAPSKACESLEQCLDRLAAQGGDFVSLPSSGVSWICR